MAASEEGLPPAIILCGGASLRMGQPKGLLVSERRYWLTAQIEGALAAGCRRVVVVLGHHLEAYRAAAPWSGLTPVEIAINPTPERGQFSSLQSAAHAVGSDAFVLPVDVPCPAPHVWRAIHAALAFEVQVVQPELGGRGGHPVLLARALIEKLRGIPVESSEARLDRVIAALAPTQRRRVSVDDSRVCLNVNTPDDWAALGARE